ncbi:MAG TPA: hypothetical protein VJQ56_11775 [Blastocatellia bacterium]|nr:hypothetical protein [Blastocatellia bacterium]
MKRTFFMLLLLVAVVAQSARAHDPRTASRDFTHSMTIEGAGKLTISYKSLHFNETAFNNRKNERALAAFNRVWKTIGKLDTEFDVVIGKLRVPKGSYSLGFNFDANDNYKLLLSGGGNEYAIDLQTAMDGPSVNYLSFDLRPETATDGFMFEVRYGKVRAWAETKVPFLSEHAHDDHNHDAKPAEKKP